MCSIVLLNFCIWTERRTTISFIIHVVNNTSCHILFGSLSCDRTALRTFLSVHPSVCLLAEAPLGDDSLYLLTQTLMSQLTVQQSYLLCWGLLPDRNRKSMGLWYWELMSHPDRAELPVGTLHSFEWFWVCRRIFIYSHHDTIVFFSKTSVRAWFVSWGSPGWQFVINPRANILVTIDCSTVLPLGLGVVTRQKLQINGSVVLGADESPWPCGTPSWYTTLSWMILSKQKNLHLFSPRYDCVFPLRRPFVHGWLAGAPLGDNSL